jgi:tRNA(Ser,Leu) C12 N-acetylase TAN1
VRDWNVVVTVRGGGFNSVRKLLREFGPIHPTGFYNVLVMRVEDVRGLLEALRDRACRDPLALTGLARVRPVARAFDYHSAEEFEARARDAALEWVPELAGKAFHVRQHRRGFKGRLSTPDEERFLDRALLAALEKAEAPGHIAFEDPDAILAVETLGGRAGLALWTREDLWRYPFLGLSRAPRTAPGGGSR